MNRKKTFSENENVFLYGCFGDRPYMRGQPFICFSDKREYITPQNRNRQADRRPPRNDMQQLCSFRGKK